MSVAVLSPMARKNLLSAVQWMALDNPAAARALRDAVAVAAAHIGKYRYVGSLRPELADEPYRFVMLTGLPYVIVYNADRKPPLIVRVLHGARDLPDILRNL